MPTEVKSKTEPWLVYAAVAVVLFPSLYAMSWGPVASLAANHATLAAIAKTAYAPMATGKNSRLKQNGRAGALASGFTARGRARFCEIWVLGTNPETTRQKDLGQKNEMSWNSIDWISSENSSVPNLSV